MTITLENIGKNCLGTASITMKVKPMRKAQEFVVYPLKDDTAFLRLQSDNRCVIIDTVTGGYRLSPSVANYPTFLHCQCQAATSGKVSSDILEVIKSAIRATSGASVGGVLVKCDNSAAERI